MGYGREEGKLLRPGALFKDGKCGAAAPEFWLLFYRSDAEDSGMGRCGMAESQATEKQAAFLR